VLDKIDESEYGSLRGSLIQRKQGRTMGNRQPVNNVATFRVSTGLTRYSTGPAFGRPVN